MQATPQQTMDHAVTQAVFDFADARKKMVDGQIRPNRVSDPRILDAMRRLPRERFLPPTLAARAYADEPAPLGHGRVMAEPLVIARLVQLTLPEVGARALVIGAGTGYGAALLAACGVHVTALEAEPALLDIARRVLPTLTSTLGLAVTVVEGPLSAGWPAAAPYDIILIEGAVHDIPTAVAAQLRPSSGRLVSVRAGRGLASQATMAEMTPAGLNSRAMFDCAMPPLAEFTPKAGFVF